MQRDIVAGEWLALPRDPIVRLGATVNLPGRRIV